MDDEYKAQFPMTTQEVDRHAYGSTYSNLAYSFLPCMGWAFRAAKRLRRSYKVPSGSPAPEGPFSGR